MKYVKKNDILIISVIIIIMTAFFLYINISSEKGIEYVEIYKNNELLMTLKEEGIYDITDKNNVLFFQLIFEEGRVRVKNSTCPDKICEHMGWSHNSKQQIICLPNLILVKPIGGEDLTGVDVYSW